MAFTFLAASYPEAADTADEARSINQKVLALIAASNLADAAALAKNGLALCDEAGAVKAFCASQFNELLGDIAHRQQRYSDALSYHRRALAIREEALGHYHLLIARSQFRVGRAALALHDNKDAETAFKDAIAVFDKLAPRDQERAGALLQLQTTYMASERFAEAVAVARQTLDAYTGLEGSAGTGVAVSRRTLGAALLSLGRRQTDQQNLVDAEKSLREGVELFDPPLPGWERVFAASLAILGKIYETRGLDADAEAYDLHALDYFSKFAAPTDLLLLKILGSLADRYDKMDRPETSAQYAQRIISALDQAKQETAELGSALIWLGRAEQKLGDYARSDATYGRALDVINRVVPESDPRRVRNTDRHWSEERYSEAEEQYRKALALEDNYKNSDTSSRSSALGGLGLVYRETARYREARQAIGEAIKIDEAAGPAQAPLLGKRLLLLATIDRREARYSDAEDKLTRALGLPLTALDRAEVLNTLGLVYSTTGQYSKAEPLLVESLSISRKILPADSSSVLYTETNLAEIKLRNSRFAEAEERRREILKRAEARGPAQSTQIALHCVLLVEAIIPSGKLDEAEALTRHAIALYQSRLGPDHPRTGGAIKELASIAALRGKDGDAEDNYRRALAIDEHVLGADNPAVAGDLVALAPVLQRLGKRQEAKASIDRALTIVTTQFGKDSLMAVGAMQASANFAYDEARYKQARGLADQIRQVQENTFGSDNTALVGSWIFAARLDIADGQLDAAGAAIDRAAAITAKSLPSGHPFEIDVLEGKADVAAARGDLAGVERYDREAQALADKLFGQDHPVHIAAVDRVIGSLGAQGELAEQHLSVLGPSAISRVISY